MRILWCEEKQTGRWFDPLLKISRDFADECWFTFLISGRICKSYGDVMWCVMCMNSFVYTILRGEKEETKN